MDIHDCDLGHREQRKAVHPNKRGPSTAILIVAISAVILLFIEYAWKFLYASGRVPGVYWLFVYLDQFIPPATLCAVVASIVFLLLGLANKLLLRNNYPQLLSISGALFIVSIALICSLLPILAVHTVHLASVQANGRVYHLAAYPLFDVFYSIEECDPSGLFCRRIYSSQDITGVGRSSSHLDYDPESKQLTLEVDEVGTLFTYQVP